ncbi:MAG: DUF2877 domain-containing protein [Rhodospirillaceae bacterium]|jgi:hypothetical protein|nr:DUF2877 domain-containing protein [Rhodospirillaceae bacterium]
MVIVLQAMEAGSIAARVLQSNTTGSVTVAFDSSFYVEIAGTLLCFGAEHLPMGPLNVRIQSPHGYIEIGMPTTIEIGNSRLWLPPEPIDWTFEKLTAGLDSIEIMVDQQAPAEGLSRFIFDPARAAMDDLLLRRASSAIDRIRQWLRGDGADPTSFDDGVRGLIGLGPGLTPSGDDFLVGIMVALAEMQETGLLEALSATIGKYAAARTNSISAAHLSAAAAGLGTDALHRTIQSILSGGDGLTGNLSDLANIGHCSGWDALAGASLALRQRANAGRSRITARRKS